MLTKKHKINISIDINIWILIFGEYANREKHTINILIENHD